MATISDEAAARTEGRKTSITTKTFNNHQGVGELKQAKKDWMTRLHDNEADFEDIFDSQGQLLNRFSLSNYVSTAMAVMKNDRLAQSAAVPSPKSPPPRPFISTATGEIVVRRRPHSVEPIPAHRLQMMATQSAAAASLRSGKSTFASTGGLGKSLSQYGRTGPKEKVQQDLMVVTGKVDYRKLKEEQKTINTQTALADKNYREMMDRFDEFNAEVERKFSVLLKSSNCIVDLVPESQEYKHLVAVSERTYNKIEHGLPTAADVL
eukprot:GGOE01002319.1.p2 GENE.GGOE01002319.1~~GGOE01002319.1.p2  ORF type:complete len:283 (-),score=85.78 GGOE01002319.1:806-1600(-)